jgi:hypothetical protein
MRIPELKTAIADAFDANLVPFAWGPPGIGKSQAVKQIADARGAAFLDIRLSMFDPVDLRGLPSILNGETVWNRPAIWPRETGRETVLFFDEFDRAPGSVVNAALQIVLDRRIGEHALPDSVRIVAAGNGATDKGTNRLPGAAANRFLHLSAEYDASATRDHFNAIGVAPEIAAFLHLRPMLGHIDALRAHAATQAADASLKAIAAGLGKDSQAWPSPRAWECVSSVMTLPSDRRAPLVAGLVGAPVASEFAAFLAIYGRAPSIASILANPSGAPVVDEIGIHYAVSTALGRAATRANLASVKTYLDRLPREFGIIGMLDAVKRDASLKETVSYGAWAIANQDVAI